MLFHSLPFLFFVVLVAGVHHLLPRDTGAQRAWMLFASWFFYATWSPPYLLLLIAVSVADFALGRALAPGAAAHPPSSVPAARRIWLLRFGLALNLAPLLLFKYARFFWDQVAGVGPIPAVPSAFLHLAAPIGISFYTFHAISYLVDCYRGAARPGESFVDVALYLAFFPKVIAGPITRWGAFSTELDLAARAGARDLEEAGFLVVRGLVKKVVLADALGAWVDTVYAGVADAGAGEAAFAFYAYPFQLYLDFSGYTDVARGVARLLGVRLPENFDHPYLATSPVEYWRRWHMTLSAWLRDYLFVPLLRAADRRRGPARGNAAAVHVVTMLLSGLWHGAGWNFVSWGGLHGIWLGLHRTWIEQLGRRVRTPLWLRWLGAFHAICATLVVFRAPTFAVAGELATALWTLRPDARPVPGQGVALVALALAAHAITPRLDLERRWLELPEAVQGIALGVAILAIVLFSGQSEPFLYFQF